MGSKAGSQSVQSWPLSPDVPVRHVLNRTPKCCLAGVPPPRPMRCPLQLGEGDPSPALSLLNRCPWATSPAAGLSPPQDSSGTFPSSFLPQPLPLLG